LIPFTVTRVEIIARMIVALLAAASITVAFAAIISAYARALSVATS
jgi:ABC-type polysaccharide transport system permease subunit